MCDRQEHLSSIIKDPECLRAHQLLSECMTENHRDWTKCQAQVKLLRRCQEQVAAVQVDAHNNEQVVAQSSKSAAVASDRNSSLKSKP
jgi:hypothetical protein